MELPNEKQLKEIFSELRDIASFLEDDYLGSILQKFGIISIEDFIKELKVYNIEAPNSDELQQEEDNAKKKKLVSINDFYIDIFLIKTLERITTESLYGKIRYGIKVNEDPSFKLPYSNKIILFKDEESRNKEWTILKQKLEYFEIILK